MDEHLIKGVGLNTGDCVMNRESVVYVVMKLTKTNIALALYRDRDNFETSIIMSVERFREKIASEEYVLTVVYPPIWAYS